MKLEVGMYVRTDKGEIKRIFQYNEQEDNLVWCTLNCYATTKSSIVKASHNIIDLIEVGDYVNGCLVERKFPEVEYAEQSIKLKGSTDYFYDIHIKSIVTKEQFESISYEVSK